MTKGSCQATQNLLRKVNFLASSTGIPMDGVIYHVTANQTSCPQAEDVVVVYNNEYKTTLSCN